MYSMIGIVSALTNGSYCCIVGDAHHEEAMLAAGEIAGEIKQLVLMILNLLPMLK